MNRSAKIKFQAIQGLSQPGQYVSDSGFTCCIMTNAKLEELPGTYNCTWKLSPVHGCNNYHLQDENGRTVVEIHPLNVPEESEGCLGPGDAFAQFAANSIRPGMPSIDCLGVTNSVSMLAKLEADMRDSEGNQVSFDLTIE